ncbi:MAG: hypothetical protein Q7S03_00670 [bacterium]|nr:hypothetical protein [bacterium]
MLELPHTIIGATIATKISNPLLSLPLVFLAHFITDFFPHWNSHIFTETQKTGKVSTRSKVLIMADTFLSLAFGLFFALKFWPDFGRAAIILFACFVATIPDTIEAPFYFLKSRNSVLVKYIKLHRKYQIHTSFGVGMTVQMIVLLVTLWILFT